MQQNRSEKNNPQDAAAPHIYKSSPIVEAVAQFYFKKEISHSSEDWIQIRSAFSTHLPQVESHKDTVLEDQQTKPRLIERFFSVEKQRLIQIGDGMFSLHWLAPYTQWSDYKDFILNGLNRYISVKSDVQQIEAIALRYINKITLEGDEIAISDYLNFFPRVPEGKNISDFRCEVMFPYTYDEHIEQLKAILTVHADNETNNPYLLLDMAYLVEHVNKDVSAALERAHKEIGELFELFITDKLREILRK